MTVIRYISLLILLVASVYTQDCQVTFQQTERSSWADDGIPHTLYDVTLQNTGSSPVTDLVFESPSSFEGYWEVIDVAGSGNKFTLPNWRVVNGGIAVGSSHQFGYIYRGVAPIAFSIATIECNGVPHTQPPTQAPTGQPTQQPTQQPTKLPCIPVTEPPVDAPTAAPTEQPTEAPQETDAPTQAPTDAPTDAPTASPTSAPTTTTPTNAPTSAPSTRAPTSAPSTRAPTSAPSTRAPTSAPSTRAPTSAPSTRAPTSAPTTKAPTTAPTTRPTTTSASPGGRVCPVGSWWAPAPQTTYQWQLTGTIDTSIDVQMYDIDLFDSSTSLIQRLHNEGRVVICYFSTQYEDWRPDAKSFTSSILGNALDDWEGERYVDIRSSVLRSIMNARLDLAVSKGCDGVEPDNVDGYQTNTGFPIKNADQIDFNSYLAAQAHQRSLSIGLKNAVDLSRQLEPHFDWSLNEQCYQYNECNTLSNFISAGKAVFNTEYSGSASRVCPYMTGIKFSALLKDLSLGAKINAKCCDYQSNGCAKVPWTCVSSVGAAVASPDTQQGATQPEVNTQEATPQQVSSAASVLHSVLVVFSALMCGLLFA